MLIGTFIIYDQMQYLRSKDLGFDKENVVRVLLGNQQSREKYPVFKNALKQNPNIVSVASASTAPGDGYGKNVMNVETNEGVMEDYGIDSYVVDYDYFPTLGVPFEKGRNISSEYPSDTATAVMVNEAMVARMGWDEPIGKKFQFDQDSTVFHRVVGVVKDFHQRSLYNPIEALMFIPSLNNSNVLIKTSGDVKAALSAIEASWNEVYPGIPFEATFLDEEFMEQYETDQLRGKLFLGFSLMMIFIACLGLLGLASFMAEQRTKEVSIRKVLGANTGGLVTLLVKDFVWLVLVGALPAFVLGYYFMNDWLQSFEYHVDINLLLFLVVLLIILIISVVTTGYHALKAANANPASNLKYE
jgi:putative ABC transport system permease protein